SVLIQHAQRERELRRGEDGELLAHGAEEAERIATAATTEEQVGALERAGGLIDLHGAVRCAAAVAERLRGAATENAAPVNAVVLAWVGGHFHEASLDHHLLRGLIDRLEEQQD